LLILDGQGSREDAIESILADRRLRSALFGMRLYPIRIPGHKKPRLYHLKSGILGSEAEVAA
jgi:hypothetical protein